MTLTKPECDESPDTKRDTTALTAAVPAGRVPVDWRRVRRPLTIVCFTMSLLAAIAASRSRGTSPKRVRFCARVPASTSVRWVCVG